MHLRRLVVEKLHEATVLVIDVLLVLERGGDETEGDVTALVTLWSAEISKSTRLKNHDSAKSRELSGELYAYHGILKSGVEAVRILAERTDLDEAVLELEHGNHHCVGSSGFLDGYESSADLAGKRNMKVVQHMG